MRCATCQRPLNERKDTRYDTDSHLFCSLLCVYRHRGKRKIV